MYAIFKLIILILRTGNFRYSGIDIPGKRSKALAVLLRNERPVAPKKPRKALMKNPFFGRVIAEGAFVKSSLRIKGGHLHAPNSNLAYVRIPRAASTSLSKALLLEKIPHLRGKILTSEEINYLTDYYLETGFTQENLPEVFTVVRNPFERIVSVYRTFFEFAQEPFQYQDYLFGILQQDFTFSRFVKTLEIIPDWLKDQHLKPQHCFLQYYERKNIPVVIMRLEDTDQIIRFLKDRQMSFDIVNRSESEYDYRRYYDRETLEAVLNLYKTDVRRFDYGEAVREIEFSIEHNPVQM